METADILFLAEAIMVRLTIFVGPLLLIVLMFWNLVTAGVTVVQLPVVIAWTWTLTKIAEHCEQDAKEYYTPKVERINEKYDF